MLAIGAFRRVHPLVLVGLAFGLGAAGAWYFLNSYQIFLVSEIALFYLCAVGLDLLIGWTGTLALAQAAFFGIGAYASAIALRHGLPLPLAGVAAALVAGVAGALVALSAVRLRGFYLAVATLAFAQLVSAGLSQWDSVTGGGNGLSVPSAVPDFPDTTTAIMVISGLLAISVGIVLRQLLRQRFGRALQVIRDAEPVAMTLGIDVATYKLAVFVLSAVIAGIAGTMFAQLQTVLTPGSFDLSFMIALIVMVFVGGRGSFWGPLAGAAFYVVVVEALQSFEVWQRTAFGAALVIIAAALPGGLASLPSTLLGRRRKPDSGSFGIGPQTKLRTARGKTDSGHTSQVLSLSNLHVAFGGNVVLSDVSVTFRPGFNGLIGPNGAGKTTCFNVITGFVRPSRGTIQINDEDLLGNSPARIARKGVARTFQTPRLVGSLTVLENVMLGRHRHYTTGYVADVIGTKRAVASESAARNEALQILDRFGLVDAANLPAKSLPLASQKIVEVSRALAALPRVLLLDEPAAGLSAIEARGLVGPLEEFATEAGMTVVIIEHDLELVSQLCPTIAVLDFGVIIASGEPKSVLAMPSVIEAYLGVEVASAS
jgi:branched-chain amino acid transport system permease protein